MKYFALAFSLHLIFSSLYASLPPGVSRDRSINSCKEATIKRENLTPSEKQYVYNDQQVVTKWLSANAPLGDPSNPIPAVINFVTEAPAYLPPDTCTYTRGSYLGGGTYGKAWSGHPRVHPSRDLDKIVQKETCMSQDEILPELECLRLLGLLYDVRQLDEVCPTRDRLGRIDGLINCYHIYMELRPGKVLSTEDHKNMSHASKADVASNLLGEVRGLHDRERGHFDLKRLNYLVASGNAVSLVDFGFCAKLIDGPRILDGSYIYHPSTKYDGDPVAKSKKIDLYGVILSAVELLATDYKDFKWEQLYGFDPAKVHLRGYGKDLFPWSEIEKSDSILHTTLTRFRDLLKDPREEGIREILEDYRAAREKEKAVQVVSSDTDTKSVGSLASSGLLPRAPSTKGSEVSSASASSIEFTLRDFKYQSIEGWGAYFKVYHDVRKFLKEYFEGSKSLDELMAYKQKLKTFLEANEEYEAVDTFIYETLLNLKLIFEDRSLRGKAGESKRDVSTLLFLADLMHPSALAEIKINSKIERADNSSSVHPKMLALFESIPLDAWIKDSKAGVAQGPVESKGTRLLKLEEKYPDLPIDYNAFHDQLDDVADDQTIEKNDYVLSILKILPSYYYHGSEVLRGEEAENLEVQLKYLRRVGFPSKYLPIVESAENAVQKYYEEKERIRAERKARELLGRDAGGGLGPIGAKVPVGAQGQAKGAPLVLSRSTQPAPAAVPAAVGSSLNAGAGGGGTDLFAPLPFQTDTAIKAQRERRVASGVVEQGPVKRGAAPAPRSLGPKIGGVAVEHGGNEPISIEDLYRNYRKYCDEDVIAECMKKRVARLHVMGLKLEKGANFRNTLFALFDFLPQLKAENSNPRMAKRRAFNVLNDFAIKFCPKYSSQTFGTWETSGIKDGLNTSGSSGIYYAKVIPTNRDNMIGMIGRACFFHK